MGNPIFPENTHDMPLTNDHVAPPSLLTLLHIFLDPYTPYLYLPPVAANASPTPRKYGRIWLSMSSSTAS